MPGRVRSTWKSVTPADPRAATIRSSARSASATRSFVPSSAPPISPRSPIAPGSSSPPSSSTASAQIRRPSAMSATARLLGGRSRAEQERRGDHRARDVRAGEAGAPHLLGQEHDVEDGPVAAAEVAGDEQSRPAELAELRPQRAAVLVQRLASGRRLERAVAGEEVAGRALQEPLAVGRAEVHRSAPAVSARSAVRGPAWPRWCAGSRRCRRRWCGRGSSSRRAG